jgi:hypothetical protein
MPIRPSERARYPKDWKAIRAAILERADNRCECTGQCRSACSVGGRTCNVPNGKIIRRFVDEPWVWVPESCRPLDRLTGPIRIVLTIAHLDHTPENNDPSNLRAMCQRCHLAYDAKHHAQNARRTRFERKAVGELFANLEPSR